MDRPRSPTTRLPSLLAGSLLVAIILAGDARGQAADKGGATPPPSGGAAAKGDRQDAKGDRPGAKAGAGAAKKQPNAGKGPSEDYQESIRRTVERRRERRARRAQGTSDASTPGAIVPWPMPPALIIRQTRETHDEIDSFLGLLRK